METTKYGSDHAIQLRQWKFVKISKHIIIIHATRKR